MIYTTQNLAREFESYLSEKISSSKNLPTLYVIQIGDNFASSKYVSIKQHKCEQLGLPVLIQNYPEGTDPYLIEQFINSIPVIASGVILQLPVSSEYAYLVDKIDYHTDIDLLTSQSTSLIAHGVLSPTIGAIDLVLKKLLFDKDVPFAEIFDSKLSLKGKTAAVIGQGKLIGTPLLPYLRDREATIISINKDTTEPQKLTKQANIVISAAGVENLIDDNWLSDGALLIDAATLESNGSQKGDVNKEKIRDSIILCPSPGGIGSLTVLYLLHNLLAFSEIFKT